MDELITSSTSPLLGTTPSWCRVPLGWIGTIQNGFAFSSAFFSRDAGIPIIRIRDIQKDRTEARFDGGYDSQYLVKREDLLVGMDGDFNCALWAGAEALLNQRVCKIEVDERFYSKRFLFYVLPGYLRAINAATSAITVKHLSSVTLESVPVPLPPLAEQRRIVAEIEKQFTILANADSVVSSARAKLKPYRASVLEESTKPRSGWVRSLIGNVADVGTGATPRRGDHRYWGGGDVPWIASAAVNNADVLEPTAYVTHAALNETNLTLYAPGTLLMAMYGEGRTRGKVSRLRIEACTNQALAAIRVRPTAEISADFLWVILTARYLEMRRMSSGGVQPNLNLGVVRSMPIAFPRAPEEQAAIVARVDRDLSVVVEFQAALRLAARRSNRVRQAILAKAFSGQLVPQNPNDEPASVLLERIRSQHASESKKKPGRRRKSGANQTELALQS